ncbi:hypothetical protein QA025_gp53 [Salmonella virus VSe101]|uniref:Uncharacterized protein n=1 Tax=Salmonella virus VSe101 TaxID=2653660 RepID=A0A5P8PNR8_9CAUD|nr:hypothetical protein QA025_gp53 [Salmonella virus VSe101]EDV0895805.1 hypothetical protein [Salmonella enterica subsp. enterica]QFR58905.1 hypothetical protein vse101_53 [Salmonella virus VSe101]
MDDKYLWLSVAGLAGGAVSQIKKREALSPWLRLCHLIASACCAVYASPIIISYYELSQSEGQYLVPFGVGMFWLKLFEAADSSLSNFKLPWGK